MAEEQLYAEKDYNKFMIEYSLENLKNMSLEKYITFCKTLTYTSKNRPFFGNIKGFDDIHFGIYQTDNRRSDSKTKTGEYKGVKYAWKSFFGTTPDQAYIQIRERIVNIVELAHQIAETTDVKDDKIKESLDKIEKINGFAKTFKWKIAFLYSDRKLVDWYSDKKLKKFVKYFDEKSKLKKTSDLQLELMKIRDSKFTSPEDFYKKLWEIHTNKNNINNEDKTMTDKNTNASLLAKNLAELLTKTKNIILHGAPGTGKTYLAKDIAAYMNFHKKYSKLNDKERQQFSEYTGFVQFHPSYDYTDFVEGLRPVNNKSENQAESDGNNIQIGFERKDGVFKKFCIKAIKNFENPQKNTTDANSSYSYLLKALKDFVNELDNKIPKNKISSHLSKSMKFFKDKLKTFESSTNNAYYVKDLFLLKIELNWFNEEFRKEIESDDELRTTSLIYKENPIIGNLKKELQDCINNLNLQNDLSTCWDLLIYEASKHDINNPLKIDKYYFIKSPKAESLKKLNKERTDVINTTIPLKRIKEVYEGKSDSKKYYHQPGKSIIDYMSKYKLESYEALQLADDAFNESTKKTPEHSENKNSFIFIIDEINRGELSKIFGELFFAIDPSYRGENGRVSTQYQNLIKDGNVFYNGFFVPNNVYIIGTMNDIDRSVESMDFAMRRRFTFKEITAKNSEEMLTKENLEGVEPKVVEQLKKRMSNLNEAIISNEIGLSSGYQIGAAYFLKYVNYLEEEKTFEALWDYNLEPLLREYLRGQGDVKNKLKQLKKAYEKESEQANNEQDSGTSK